MMLDRANYYATTGGHGACRGCGEVTAIRLVMSANHAIQGKRRKEHVREPEACSNTTEKCVDPGRFGPTRAHMPRWRRSSVYLLEKG
jgi:pyruvate/2-oxoacid:ferredoxin oxidoreductase beta subunit